MDTKINIEKIRSEFLIWKEKHARELSQQRKPQFLTREGFVKKALYTPLELDESEIDYLRDIGFSGQYPFVRAIEPQGYRGRLWDMSQYAGRATPEETNVVWKKLVAQGATVLATVMDMPTHLCLDPDDPQGKADVGKVGTSLSTLRDYRVLLDGIDLRTMWVSLHANAQALFATACLLAVADEQGVEYKQLKGAVQNDILKELYSRGCYIVNPKASLKMAIDVVEYCAKKMPSFLTMQFQSYALAEAGANRVHEIAFVLSNVKTYLEAAVKRGIDIDSMGPKIMFLLEVSGNGFFEEIAKVRAMRKVYAHMMRDTFGAKNPESMKVRASGCTGGTNMLREQYLVNISRATLGSFAGALAGVQYIDGKTYDEAWGVPTDGALMIALRGTQVVAYETGVADVVDPLGGSYYLECLTKQYEEAISKEMDKIDKLGGVLACIEKGYLSSTIAQDAYQEEKDIQSGEIVKVGRNMFRIQEPKPERDRYRVYPEIVQKRIDTIREVRRKRDNGKVQKALANLREVSRQPNVNLMDAMVEAAKVEATVGEVYNVLKEAYGGTYREGVSRLVSDK